MWLSPVEARSPIPVPKARTLPEPAEATRRNIRASPAGPKRRSRRIGSRPRRTSQRAGGGPALRSGKLSGSERGSLTGVKFSRRGCSEEAGAPAMVFRGHRRNHKRSLRSHGRFPGTSRCARRADALPWKRWQNGTRSHQRRPRANKAPVREGIRRGSWVTCQTPSGQPVKVETGSVERLRPLDNARRG